MLDVPGPRLLRTPSRFALEVGRLAVDAVPRPGRLPRSTADLDAATLSRVLGRDVERVSVLDGTSGTTDRSRLAVEGRDLPGSVFVKMAATDAAPGSSEGWPGSAPWRSASTETCGRDWRSRRPRSLARPSTVRQVAS